MSSEWCVWGVQSDGNAVTLVNMADGARKRIVPVELAAAAPELLAALEALVKRLDDPTPLAWLASEYRGSAVAAIAKAEVPK